MDYLFSKALTQLVMPLGMGGILVFTGAAMMAFRRRGLGSTALLAGLLWVWLWATPVFSDWVRRSLEGRYSPAALESVPKADAILVLGGSVSGAAAPRLFPELSGAADRVWHGARLYHSGKAPVLVVSGGQLPWDAGQGPEAEAMLQFLVDLGVPADRVLLEGRSRTTYENARETQRLLEVEGLGRVLLVTSALHMLRAEATFRAAGVDVVPAPTDFEVVVGEARTLLDYLPDAGALEGSSRAFKEYLGLMVYRWRGWAAW